MLSKLLKYDFKSLSKTIFPIYLVSLLLALLTRGVNMLADKFNVFSIPSGFISAIFVIVLIAIPIMTFVFTILKFYQNLIKDEGYLMHTLPVSKHSLILSKTISSTTFILLSFIMSILFLFVGVYGIWFDSSLLSFIGKLLKEVNSVFILLIILSTLISVIFNQVMIYASIALGQKHNNKIMYSIIYGVVLYNVTQIISLVILIPVMFLDSNYQQYINATTISDFALINGYLLFAFILSVLFTVGYYILTVKVLDKKLNLE